MEVREAPPDFWRDYEWIRQHTDFLHQHYEEEWIAVVGQQVVAHDPDLERVWEQAGKRTGRDRWHIPVRFIESNEVIY
jgi:hypothetical protein